jgi:hypothetical protein
MTENQTSIGVRGRYRQAKQFKSWLLNQLLPPPPPGISPTAFN